MAEIRPATADDTAGIRRVARAAYEETYVGIVGQDGVDALLSAWYDPAALRERLAADDGAQTFVAVDAGDDERVVGYAGAAVPPDEDEPVVGHLPTLYVHPDRWGEGIGCRLFDRARAHLAERGVERMRIRVFAENEVGRDFYEDRAELVEETTDDLDPIDHGARVGVYEAEVE